MDKLTVIFNLNKHDYDFNFSFRKLCKLCKNISEYWTVSMMDVKYQNNVDILKFSNLKKLEYNGNLNVLVSSKLKYLKTEQFDCDIFNKMNLYSLHYTNFKNKIDININGLYKLTIINKNKWTYDDKNKLTCLKSNNFYEIKTRELIFKCEYYDLLKNYFKHLYFYGYNSNLSCYKMIKHMFMCKILCTRNVYYKDIEFMKPLMLCNVVILKDDKFMDITNMDLHYLKISMYDTINIEKCIIRKLKIYSFSEHPNIYNNSNTIINYVNKLFVCIDC